MAYVLLTMNMFYLKMTKSKFVCVCVRCVRKREREREREREFFVFTPSIIWRGYCIDVFIILYFIGIECWGGGGLYFIGVECWGRGKGAAGHWPPNLDCLITRLQPV